MTTNTYVTGDIIRFTSGEAAARIKIGGARYFYDYCSRHGLFKAAFR